MHETHDQRPDSRESASSSLPSPLVFPLNDNEQLVKLLSEVMNRPTAWTRNLLYQEELNLGQYHRQEFKEWGIEPFVWSDALVEYYRKTDSAISGQPTWNRRKEKLQMRQWIGSYLQRTGGGPQKVLMVGDGAGFDSLYLSKCGHTVTYSEEGAMNIALAQRIFELNRASIEIETNLDALTPERFDVVVCLDVLEHVSDPPSLVSKMMRLMRPGGRLIVHAPFFFVSPMNPTHLRSNIQYSGNLSRLYGAAQLVLVDGRLLWDPLVFAKPTSGKRLQRRFVWLCMLRTVGLALAFARVNRVAHNWVATRVMQNRNLQWLKGLEPDANHRD
jgi:SAM-dependent methyltransferase